MTNPDDKNSLSPEAKQRLKVQIVSRQMAIVIRNALGNAEVPADILCIITSSKTGETFTARHFGVENTPPTQVPDHLLIEAIIDDLLLFDEAVFICNPTFLAKIEGANIGITQQDGRFEIQRPRGIIRFVVGEETTPMTDDGTNKR